LEVFLRPLLPSLWTIEFKKSTLNLIAIFGVLSFGAFKNFKFARRKFRTALVLIMSVAYNEVYLIMGGWRFLLDSLVLDTPTALPNLWTIREKT